MENNEIYLIGNAHLDPVWFWRWQEGFAEIKATFKSALDRLEEYPQFVFTSACAAYYEWVENNEPDMFAQIQNYVREGRWVIVGGWYLQPDCNIPSGESLARHGLLSQRYFMEKFGVMSTVGYNVDSFGHNGMIPQILKQSGMDYYVFHRPYNHEKSIDAQTFWWKGIDGSRVIAYKIPLAYNMGWEPQDIIRDLDEIEKLSDDRKQSLMLFYGVGNHGGGPTRAVIETIMDRKKIDARPVFKRIDEYFHLIQEEHENLIEISGDLQHHASGCYSACAEIKRNNRRAENRIVSTEKTMSLAKKLLNVSYDNEKINKAWKDVLFNQFHDIMGGCSIKEAYQDAREFHGEALKISADLRNACMQKISWNIDTMGENTFPLTKEINWALWEIGQRGIPVVLFNMNSWEVEAPVVINKTVASIESPNLNTVAIQKVRAPQTNIKDKWDTMFIAKVPPMGYTVYNVFLNKESEKIPPKRMLIATDHMIENEYFRMEFDEQTGYIKSIFDKKRQCEKMKTFGAVPMVIEDENHDTWAHNVFTFHDCVGKFKAEKISLLEIGDVYARIRVQSVYNRSTLLQDFTVYREVEDIDVKIHLNWQEPLKFLKMSFDVNCSNPKAVYSIPYGYITKPADGQEEAGQAWVSCVGENGGIGIANTGSYSYSVEHTDMRFVVARSPYYTDHYGERDEYMEAMDIGIHELQYKIVLLDDDSDYAKIEKKAHELNAPIEMVIETYHKGSLPLNYSLLTVNQENIIAQTLKQSEDKSAVVIRFNETAGLATQATINCGYADSAIQLFFSPFEIKTLMFENGKIYESNLIETEKKLLDIQ